MGKKSDAPPPPDYAALAQQQAALNKDAAVEQTVANRPTQNTPWGSTSWAQGPDGQWTQNVTLDPAEQAALDQQRQFSSQQQGFASGLLDQAGQSLSQPMSLEGLPQLQGYDMSALRGNANLSTQGLPAQGQLNIGSPRGRSDGLDQRAIDADPAGFAKWQAGKAAFDAGQSSPGALSAQGQLSMGGLQGRCDGLDQRAIDADPAGFAKWQADKAAFDAGQSGSNGLPAQGQLNPGALSAQGQLSTSGLPGLSDMDMSGMSKLDPGFGAVESVRDAMMSRLAPSRQQSRDSEIQRLKNQGIPENSEAFQRALTRLDQGDTDAQQQALLGAAGEYGNIFNRGLSANNQQLQQQQAIASLRGNQRSQLFNEQGAGAALANQNRAQQFGENQSVADFNQRVRGQQFGEQGQQAQLAGMLRQQSMAEQDKLRQSPMNDFLRLTQGINPTMPQMPSFMAGTGYQAADMAGAGQQQYNAAMNNFNADQARGAGLTSGLFGLAGSALGGPLGGKAGSFIGGLLGK